MTDAPSCNPEIAHSAPAEALGTAPSPSPRAASSRTPPLARWTFCLPTVTTPANGDHSDWLEFFRAQQ